jgi:hypothetical protein
MFHIVTKERRAKSGEEEPRARLDFVLWLCSTEPLLPAISIFTDLSSEESVKSDFKTVAHAYDDAPCAAAIYNASGGFVGRLFVDTQVEDLDKKWAVTVYKHVSN